MLDGTRITQVCQHGPFVLALFDIARELREGQHGDVESLGDGLDAARDFRDLDGTVLTGLQGVGASQELEIVDDEVHDAVLAFHALGPGTDCLDREIGRQFDIEGLPSGILRSQRLA